MSPLHGLTSAPTDGQAVWTVQQSQPQDFEELATVERAARPPGSPATYAVHAFWARARLYERSRCVVLRRGNEVVGAALGAVKRVRLGESTQSLGHIFNLRVVPEARRGGGARALVRELSRWFADSGAIGEYCLVDERNLSSLGLFESLGFRTAARSAYLVVQRGAVSAPNHGVRFVDWGDGSSEHVAQLADYAGRDLCPSDLRETVYRKMSDLVGWPHGGYLGTLVTNIAGTTSSVSAWDKDRAIGRRTLAARDRSIFLFDLRLGAPDAWSVLCSAVFERWPGFGRAVVFTHAERVHELAPAALDRVELVLARMPNTVTVNPRPYLDIRD